MYINKITIATLTHRMKKLNSEEALWNYISTHSWSGSMGIPGVVGSTVSQESNITPECPFLSFVINTQSLSFNLHAVFSNIFRVELNI